MMRGSEDPDADRHSASMDASSKKERPRHPRATASWLSALTFWWTLGTFVKGYKRDLEDDDLFQPLKSHESDGLGDKLEMSWIMEERRARKLKKSPSLLRALVRVFGLELLCYGFLLLVTEILVRVAQPLFLGQLIRYFTPGSGVTKEAALWYAGAVVLCSGFNIVAIHPYMMAILHMGMKIRVACCSLVYRKSLRLSKTALGETTVGQVVNLLANDVNRFDVAVIFVHYLWIGPLETVVASYFMYQEVGVSALFGIASLLLFIPLQGYLGKKTSTYRLKTAIRTDERVRLMNEIISGIQVIKVYTWEKPFALLVKQARKHEINIIRIKSYISGVILSFIMFSTRLSMFLTILAFVLLGGTQDLTAEKVFVLTSYYNVLRQTMTVFFPQGITLVSEGWVSVKRLQKFLLYEETTKQLPPSKVAPPDDADAPQAYELQPLTLTNGVVEVSSKAAEMNMLRSKVVGVKLTGVTARWKTDAEHAENTLSDVTLAVGSEKLVAVIGPVGAGKTSLLHVILKELPVSSGRVDVSGRVSYASQEPWLFAGSVRQNILFGQAFDRDRYNRVVAVCALKRDFQLLPYGDKTVVGERGVSLSGGQRARINLARAVYVDADVYLLDDPLSAVDAHVGRHLFDDCVRDFLRHKACILVTHQLQYLKNLDHILVINNGRVESEGSYSELQETTRSFTRLLKDKEVQEEEDLEDSSSLSRSSARLSIGSSTSVNLDHNQPEPQEVAEMRSYGSVGSKVYGAYLSAGGNCCVIVSMFILFFLAQLTASGSDYWLTYWINVEEQFTRDREQLQGISGANYTSNDTYTSSEEEAQQSYREMCIYVYTAVVVAVVVVSLVRSCLFVVVCMRASINLHNSMFEAVTRATMYFFNTNSSGRILNRFSKDMGSIDEMLPQTMVDTLQIGLGLIGIITVVAVVNFWLLLPTFLIGIVFYLLRIFYLATSRSIKRLEGTTRSPVFSHINASLQGLTTIRAFGAQLLLQKEFDRHQDLHSSAWYLFIAFSRAFGFWLDIFCLVYIALVTFSFLALGQETFGGNVGLAITQSIGLTGMFQWGMRQSAELENQMTSVERVLEYTNLEKEPMLESAPDKKPNSEWPSQGKISFINVYLRYSKKESPVLKNLNFVINPREKVGIVGRTGAGKSSLIAALFRLAELEGSVVIDGVDTASIGLHDLREKVSIIPQEPVLFSGTLRKNLDPFDEFPDHVLWKALEEVELKEAVDDLASGLNSKMSEGGSNFSVGQRQLVCLARAIVRSNKVLVLDEATANVDPKTDALIQTTIRRKFADCTVLTIAHRLNTVMDSDKVLVMDAGVVVEYDHPHILLQNENGFLYKMVQQTGKSMMEVLKRAAEKTFTVTKDAH